jgi:hypothetical protein
VQWFAEGASVATIRLELSAIRSFWAFMIEVEAFGAFFNVATGVKVGRRKSNGQIASEELIKPVRF